LNKRSKHPRGYFLFDVLTGLAILLVMTSLLAVALKRHYAASEKLADSRSAVRLAERTLLAMQHHQPAPLELAKIEITPRNDQPAPQGFAWAHVQVSLANSKAELIGIVPSDTLAKEGK